MRVAEPAVNRTFSVGFTYSWCSPMRTRRPEQWAFAAGRSTGGASPRHVPVLLDEVLSCLPLRPGAVAVDATVGLGGHAWAMIERIGPGGTLVGLDWDSDMLEVARRRLGEPEGVRIHLLNEDFRQVERVLKDLGLEADAILFDLGLNTAQVLDPARGFSFSIPGPLDMRQDRTRGEPASALLNRMSPGEIESVLMEFGNERWARAIAKAIVARRKAKAAPLWTTEDLVDCVLEAIPPKAREKRIHPATRTFQAFRILVNRELEGLGDALRDAAHRLAPGGAMAVISYHSGEDRIVKRAMRALADEGFEELFRKPVQPSGAEIAANPRSRSAKLRALRRTERA
jgi:16S rRNA (cytosine1402-N4)-methyltransferase